MTDRPGAAYDLIVIGAGAAGSTAAVRGAGRRARAWRWPSAGRWAAPASTPAAIRPRRWCAPRTRCTRRGRPTGSASRSGTSHADWPAVIARVERVIDTIRGGDGDRNIREAGIDLRKGQARLLSPTEVEVNGDIAARRGGHPGHRRAGDHPRHPRPGRDRVHHERRSGDAAGAPALAGDHRRGHDRAWSSPRSSPASGCEVTILGRNPRLLPHEEPELAAILRERWQRRRRPHRDRRCRSTQRLRAPGERKRIVGQRGTER